MQRLAWAQRIDDARIAEGNLGQRSARRATVRRVAAHRPAGAGDWGEWTRVSMAPGPV